MKEDFLKTYDEFSDAIFRYCFFKLGDREVAKDITQETFTKTWEYIVSGKEVLDMKPFLYRVAGNLVIDTYRKKREDFSLEKMYEEGFDMPVDVGDSEVQYILEAMSKLGDGCKNPLIMRFVEDMKVKDIADILNMSENAVSVRLKRCVDRLSKIINHE